MARVRKSARSTVRARPKGKRYFHQGLLSFAKEYEWKYHILERFQQNSIHLLGYSEKPNSILIELGSHKRKPGGLRADPWNLDSLASVFSLRMNRNQEMITHHHAGPYIGLTSNEIKRRIGSTAVSEWVNSTGKPVLRFWWYHRKLTPPSQRVLHRWFVEFFPDARSIQLAEAITERNARKAGSQYLEWAKKKANEKK